MRITKTKLKSLALATTGFVLLFSGAPSPLAHAGDETHQSKFEKAVDSVEEALRLNRRKLTAQILADETERGTRDRMRVHLSEALVVVRETDPVEVSHKVDSDGIEEIIQQDRRVQTLKPKAKGKILDAEGEFVWVKFTDDCASRECAFTFVEQDGKYVLDSVPLDLTFQRTSVYVRVLGVIRENVNSPKSLHKLIGKELHLKVDKDTITNVSVERETIDGVSD
ncbi:MAG: hypothetical protein AAB425_09250 [Bdellovibrionota bacterium]